MQISVGPQLVSLVEVSVWDIKFVSFAVFTKRMNTWHMGATVPIKDQGLVHSHGHPRPATG